MFIGESRGEAGDDYLIGGGGRWRAAAAGGGAEDSFVFFMFCQRILMPLPDKETLKRISLPARIHFTERTGPLPLDPTPSYCNELDLSLGFFFIFSDNKRIKIQDLIFFLINYLIKCLIGLRISLLNTPFKDHIIVKKESSILITSKWRSNYSFFFLKKKGK